MMKTDTHPPTPEQSEILRLFAETSDNILINAYAGTGKTSTLEMIQAAYHKRPILCLAFNRKIADEMEKRFLDTTVVRSFNGLGHRVWAKTVPNISLNTKPNGKIRDLLAEELKLLKGDDRVEASEAYWDIISAVNLAKSLGYVPEGKFPHAKRLISTQNFFSSLDEDPSPLLRSLIDSILVASIKAAYNGGIDFNDQVYMPALFGGTFPRFPLTLVDETQDLSPTNHAMLHKLVKDRLGAVGDPWQSIYGFRGALQEGMSVLKERFLMVETDLSVSFRCPRAIVEAARWRVPNFKWVKEGGIVGELRNPTLAGFTDNSAIICRNNAPLFRLAFQLLGAKRSVQVAGSEIGPKIIGVMRKIADDDDRRQAVLDKIEDWKLEKLITSRAPATIHDMAECMKVFASYGETMSSAIAHAEYLFKQQGSIKLTTGHKAKGLEWDIVYHLDPWIIGESGQELNLRYVIQTRAKEAYYEINTKDIR